MTQQNAATIESLLVITQALQKLEELNKSITWEDAYLPIEDFESTALPEAISNLRYVRSQLAYQLPESN